MIAQASFAVHELSTARVHLRPAAAHDAAALAGMAGRAVTDSTACLVRAAASRSETAPKFVIDIAGEGPAGVIAFRPGQDEAPEMGLWLAEPFRGRGLGEEAVRAALGWSSARWGRRWVRSGHLAQDAAAARTLIKAGFLYTGDCDRVFTASGDSGVRRRMVWLA